MHTINWEMSIISCNRQIMEMYNKNDRKSMLQWWQKQKKKTKKHREETTINCGQCHTLVHVVWLITISIYEWQWSSSVVCNTTQENICLSISCHYYSWMTSTFPYVSVSRFFLFPSSSSIETSMCMIFCGNLNDYYWSWKRKKMCIVSSQIKTYHSILTHANGLCVFI